MNKGYELVELDANGNEDELKMVGTFAQCSRALHEMIEEFQASGDWDDFDQAWPTYRVQPAR